jgi:hypothetical protein
MRTLSLVLSFAVIGSLSACRSPEEVSAPARLVRNLPSIRIPPDSSPFFTTDQVLRIATEAVKTNRLSLVDYKCTDIIFGAGSMDTTLSNKWVLRFAKQPESPDFEFFVVVEDHTGKSTLRRW